MSDEKAEQQGPTRPEWLGEPYEHGGGYRPSRTPGRLADAGCCLIEAAGAFGGLAVLFLLLI